MGRFSAQIVPQCVIRRYSPRMGEPLTLALARAASRFVGESKVGTRKGSAAAVARAMTDHGVPISSATLSRKLAGEYPFDSDEIGALAAVIGADPDAIWRDALRIMHETPAAPVDELEAGLSPSGRAALDQARADHGVTPQKPPAKRPRRSA